MEMDGACTGAQHLRSKGSRAPLCQCWIVRELQPDLYRGPPEPQAPRAMYRPIEVGGQGLTGRLPAPSRGHDQRFTLAARGRYCRA